MYLELAADSIVGDAHKMLNVPYDCGSFLCRHPEIPLQVFKNPNAAYLNTGEQRSDPITPSMNTGIENSSRLKGLPVYAALVAYGWRGYEDMLERHARFGRAVASLPQRPSPFSALTRDFGSGL